MKSLAKRILVTILGNQVQRLRSRNNFTVVAVVGSVGKTSTKFAIASMLSSKLKVQWQQGNYNDTLSVPLVFFGHSIPSLHNPFSWLKIISSNELLIRKKYPYDVVVIELGTDGPGQIEKFSAYLHNDIAVVTAVSPEHMEYFDDIDAVATEELSVSNYTKQLIINSDLVIPAYFKALKSVLTYGFSSASIVVTIRNNKIVLTKNSKLWCILKPSQITTVGAYSVTAGAMVADMLGLTPDEIEQSIASVVTPPGRMQFLPGINNSIIIDETYNASPDAVITALEYLYDQKASQRIALLGNMNELGKYSKAEHERVGKFCDPKKLDYVLTLGPDANAVLGPIAQERGCRVKAFTSPYELGNYVKKILKDKAVILAKGSQNNVYMEEAVKLILANTEDVPKLVRQSEDWLQKKQKNFSRG
jgi:UDP-N-acetylmuramoyl-tripeptide--D-alanyl-D-alanine ligase